VHELRATGGFARSPFWRQLLTDVLGVPIGFPQGHHGSGLGAALVGLRALGLAGPGDAPAPPVAETLRPDPATAEGYAALLPVFADLQVALEPGLRRLRALAPED
jgi:gluconokinase